MPRTQQSPAQFVASGDWPDVELAEDAPPEAVVGLAFVLRLRGELAERSWSARELGRQAGVAHTTINRLLAGEVLPDVATIVRLEVALRIDLYPAGLWAELADKGE
ncbi:helix-turn-helix domain-containing protein [Kitasatospora xanthocidica]|uniref:helix-turn-helix domain-containing protein n=1 Tax=Kitasatospora xanthocidica TaxID=83382 RepID=UPI00216B5D0E|nr:helix-turn-helix transcriptional regulator [Kitasatospora xanthocidica]